MIAETVKWVGDIDGRLELIDQRRLPTQFVKLSCDDVDQLYDAIKTLAVRGAPAIGVAAAYGPLLALQRLDRNADLQQHVKTVEHACDHLAGSRPTAVNLFWALDRIRNRAAELASKTSADPRSLREGLLAEAHAIRQEDVDMCAAIGRHGEKLLQDGFGVLTHCNAGALATAGQGTALSVIFEAHKNGKCLTVYADETRPLLQGARLTAWELRQAGIDTYVICDNMAGWLMKQGKIDAIITGADRIAANGDTGNKIGTYSLSILAKQHGVPFYVAAPSSTFDLTIDNGSQIPIEQRPPEEVTTLAGAQIAPDGVNVYNPAFDVTDAANIAAIITEKGLIEQPNTDRIRRLLVGE